MKSSVPRNPVRTVFARVIAPNDANGNPRRGWIVYKPEWQHARQAVFVDEGYNGDQPLRAFLPRREGSTLWDAAASLGDIHVSGAEYKRLRTGE